jgi:hypothetical protein
MSVTREELYEQAWSEPMLKVAAKYDVSSSFLARVFERLNIPRPQRGYWVQLEAGKAPTRPPLPPPRPGDELEWSRDGTPARAPREPPRAPVDGTRIRRRRKDQRPQLHKLLVGTREQFLVGRVSDVGYLRPQKRLLPDIFVSKDALDRAFAIANDLYLTLEDFGFRVVFAPTDVRMWRSKLDERSVPAKTERYFWKDWQPARPTLVYVGSVAIGLTLFELSEPASARYRDGRYYRIEPSPVPARGRQRRWEDEGTLKDMPSGRLGLQVYSPYPGTSWEQQWRESKPGDLASKTDALVRELRSGAASIPPLVEEVERQREIAHQRWLVQQAQWEREAKERRHAQNLKDSREQLDAVIKAWAAAKAIEDFFDDIERRGSRLGEAERAALRARLDRARELAGGVDALEHFLAWRSPGER